MNQNKHEFTIALLAFQDVEELDLVGPWEVLKMWQAEEPDRVSCHVVAKNREPIKCANGLVILPEYSFEDCPAPSVLLVPGGQGTRVVADDESFISFISSVAAQCRAVLSVCTGAFLLERAELLKGKEATTYWRSLDRLKACDDVKVVSKRYVKDGNTWTSAGVSAGIDMALAFIADVAGEQTAGRVQKSIEYFPDRIIYPDDSSTEGPRYLKERS